MTAEVQIPADDLPVGARRQIDLDGRAFFVFNTGRNVVAYEDRCLHQRGPVCSQGTFHPLLSARIDDDGEVREYHVDDATVLSCPWHGWEYDLDTGEFLADRRMRLRSARVTVDDGVIHVAL